MIHIRKYLIALIVLFSACQDNWEEHNKLNQDVAEGNLMQIISGHPNLSKFAGYLIQTGWDKELSSSKSFTVWAPTDEAMAQVEQSILNDSAKLNQFVSNHICFLRYSYYSTKELQKIKAYSGKNIIVDNLNGKVEDASLIWPYDLVADNGILHVIDKPLIPKMNIWEFVEQTDLCPKHSGYLNSLTGMVFNPSIATQIGVDPISGKDIYDTASGMVWSNRFINNVRDLKDEDSLSTMILISDDVWDQEFTKFRNYYRVGFPEIPELTDSLTQWHISKDLVFSGSYKPDNIPDTLISLFGVKVPFNKTAVETMFEASNGIVYTLSNCYVRLQDKIRPIIIEGEDTNKFVFTSLVGQTGYTREKVQASGGYDFILDNHGLNPGNIKYYAGEVCAMYYKFYWKAVNDFDGSYRYPNANLVLKQKLEQVKLTGYMGRTPVWGTPAPISELINVSDSTYGTAREVFVGEYLYFSYQDTWLQVTGGGNNMTIVLDYIKMVPVFE
jgi:uncharacterized surface protein with fasciclin (FAS1) repeats